MLVDKDCQGGIASGASGFTNQKSHCEWRDIALQFPSGTNLSGKLIGGKEEFLNLNCFAIKLDGAMDT